MYAKQLLPSVMVLLAIFGLSSVSAAPSKAPLRLRLSSDLLKTVFVKNDQQLLDVFEDLPLGEFQLTEDISVSNVTGSLIVEGDKEQFDFDMSLDESKFLGLETTKFFMKGKGLVFNKGEQAGEFEFLGPIDLLRLEFHMVEQITKLNTSSQVVDYKQLVFEVDTSKLVVKGENEALQTDTFKNWLKDHMKDAIVGVKHAALYTNPEIMFKVPITSIVPLFGLYYASLTADKAEFNEKFIEFQYSPEKFKLISDKAYSRLKDIDSDFEEPEEGDQRRRALQVLLDENVLNSVFSHFATMDTMYSLRKVFHKDPKFAVFRQLLTTTTLGMVLPSFKEDYGEGKPIDLIGTLSHDFLADSIEGIQFSGVTLDSKGMLKGTINAGAQIIIEKNPGEWEDARQFYFTIQFKAKLYVNETGGNKTLTALPKGIEIQTFKIYKGDEEMFLEQILTQSLLNAQIDQLRKSFKPVTIGSGHVPKIKEANCMGFNITDVVPKIRKGFIQIDVFYDDVKEKDEIFCEQFEKAIREGPMKTFNQFTQQFQQMGNFANKMVPGIPGMPQIPGMPSFTPQADTATPPLTEGFIRPKKAAEQQGEKAESSQEAQGGVPKIEDL